MGNTRSLLALAITVLVVLFIWFAFIAPHVHS